MFRWQVQIVSRGPVTPVLPPPPGLVLAGRLKPSSCCSLGQRPLCARASLPAGTAPAPRAPFCRRPFPCSGHVKRGLGGCWRGGSGLQLHGGMLRLVLCFLAETEAKKACDWLRAAGFPQYAQLYEGESLRVPAPALSRGSRPVSRPNTTSGCGESSQRAAERRGWRGLFTNYTVMC